MTEADTDIWARGYVEVSVGSQLRTLPAGHVGRIEQMPALAIAPTLPFPVLGVASMAGQVIPVVDLASLLGLASSPVSSTSQIVMVVRQASALAAVVDRVSRVCAEPDGGDAELRIDVDGLFAAVARLGPHPVTRSTAAAPAPFRKESLTGKAMPIARPAASALAVSTGERVHYLSLAHVSAVSQALSIVAVPDPRPAVLGLAIHAGAAIPVLQLASLLGAPSEARGDWGAVMLTSVDGACAVAVREVIGFASGIETDRHLDLLPLVHPFLDNNVRLEKSLRARARGEQAYVLAEIGRQLCAFRLDDVVRVQGQGATASLPGRWLNASGLANVDGAVLPLLDAGALTGLGNCEHPGGYVVLTESGIGSFVVPVHRLVRIAALADASLRPAGEETGLAAVGSYGDRSLWVFASAQLGKRIARNRHAA